jgi:hypothetical protein
MRDPRLGEPQPSVDASCCRSTVTPHYAPGQVLALAYFSDAAKCGSAPTHEEVLVKLPTSAESLDDSTKRSARYR